MKVGVMRRQFLIFMGATMVLGMVPVGARAQLFSFPDWYTLANAASDNKPASVRALLNRGDNPNFTDSTGRTPLDYAAIHGNAEITKMLLDGGARPDYRDTFGGTALHWAAQNGRVEVIRLLVAAKAPVDAINKQGITPLMMAAGNNRGEAVKALLQGGADPKKQDFTGRDALGWAVGQPSALRVLETSKPG